MMKRIRKFLKWDWGKQTYKGFGQSDDEFRGFSAPLWINTSPLTFLVMSLWGVTVFLSLLFLYIFYIANLISKCNVQFKPLIIFELCVVGINSIFDFRSYTKRYETDQGWSRSLIYLTFQIALLALSALLGILYNGFSNCTYDLNGASCVLGSPSCFEDNTKNLFIASSAITANIIILLITKISILIAFSFKYYYEPKALLAVAKQIQQS